MPEEVQQPEVKAAEVAATPQVEKTKTAQDATPAGKFYSDEELNKIIQKRLERATDDKAEKKAQELAAESLQRVKALETERDASNLEAQLLRLAGKGADVELLAATGLTGEALDAYAEKLIAKLPGAAAQPAAKDRSAASIAARINSTVKSSESKPGDWKSAVLDDINSQLGR